MNRSFFDNVVRVTIAAFLLTLCGCEQTNPAATQPTTAAVVQKPASSWHGKAGSEVVVVRDESSDRALNDAMTRARATAADARMRWSQAAPDDRARWAVKWAAPVDSDSQADSPRVEHLWVRPVNWSAFRIEGILASDPVQQLVDGKKLGDLVSFSIDELSDWVHFTSGSIEDFSGPHEGGFTLKVLDERFGKPLDSK